MASPALAVSAVAKAASSAIPVHAAAAALPLNDVYAVNAGGAATGGFTADADFARGFVYSTKKQVNTTGVANAAPSAVYQSAREGSGFSYTFPGLQPTILYAVILHFAELYWTLPLQREFNVSMNGTRELTDYDIAETAGPLNASVQTFFVRADANGVIKVDFTRGAYDQPTVNGIEIRNDN